MRYDLIRLILLVKDRELFSPPNIPSRETWLRKMFSVEIVFDHYGNEFHYVPEPEASDARLIVGRIGRARPVTENDPPEAGLREVERESWIAAGIIIDPSTHTDGQKAAIEDNARVGNPASIFKSLVRRINDRGNEPYIIEANPIVDPDTFWEFERQNRGEITSVSFDLYAPNMFGLRNELDKELRELRDNEKVREAKLTLENKDGLDLQTERVRQTVDYTLEGGGNIRTRTKRKKRYNSKQRTKMVVVEDGAPKNFVGRIGAAIARLFAPS
jgi:hypothetical protein